jgi:uncharacterized protein (TIGR02680 family)
VTIPLADFEGLDSIEQTQPQHHPYRWRMNRAGILDIWYYYDTEFDLSGGRMVLRGTNGSGKSRALELLLPFLLDADRRKMDATGSGKVNLVEMMKTGSQNRSIRVGYLWLELARTIDPEDPDDAALHAEGLSEQYLTIGAYIRFSRSASEVTVHYFTTERRVGIDLELMSKAREVLPRETLAELIGADRITKVPGTHRDRVRAAIFTLTGDSGGERYAGLLQLLYTLRSPDVGNRIDEGRLPLILSEALPPLNETAVNSAGEQLDGLSETRAAQERLEAALGHVEKFLDTYRGYAATAIAETIGRTTTAATDAEEAVKVSEDGSRKCSKLKQLRGQIKGQLGELVEDVAALDARISGIQQSKAYAGARDLDERELKVGAFGSAADSEMKSAGIARSAEDREVRTSNAVAHGTVETAKQAAAALAKARAAVLACGAASALPLVISVEIVPAGALTDSIRSGRFDGMSEFHRPVHSGLVVLPEDLGAARGKVKLVEIGVKQRGGQAEGRLLTARGLDAEHGRVKEAERRAEEAGDRAREAAEEQAGRQTSLVEAGLEYADGWRQWSGSAETVAAFGGSLNLTGTVVAAVLDDSSIIEDMGDGQLVDLDRVGGALASDAIGKHMRRRAELETAGAEAILIRNRLWSERTQLESAVDTGPELPQWMLPITDGGVPLWQAIDFVEGLVEEERAGLEGALLSSGLLLATIQADGTLRATDGELLLTPTGPIDQRPVTGKIIVDPAAMVPPQAVAAVLSRIGYRIRGDDPTGVQGTWVASDGSWQLGPLTGRHTPETAQHIGAAARKAARRIRLTAIEAALTALADAQRDRDMAWDIANNAIAALNEAARATPSAQVITAARALAMESALRTEKARSAADVRSADAAALRRRWARADTEHRALCSEFGLPHLVEELDAVRRATDRAESACSRLGDQLTDLEKSVTAHRQAVAHASDRTNERVAAEAQAAMAWAMWHSESLQLESVSASIGQEAAVAKTTLNECQATHRKMAEALETLRNAESDLGEQVGAAEAEARNAALKASSLHSALIEAVDRLQRRLALPGLAAAAFTTPPGHLALPEIAPVAVLQTMTRMAAGLRRYSHEVDENALIRPLQNLERELSGTYDVITELHDGVRLVELSDAVGQRTVADTAIVLTRTVDEGRLALSDRERNVFTEFVLGGVAEELRRRLVQAEALIAAMNASLGSIRTSHGIGVKLRWRIADGSDPTVVRIKELVSTAGAVRSVEQAGELTELLKIRVEQAFALDESAGYATLLREALDYRNWHQIEVMILGPAPGQERHISRKARLSQGEIRFVSYVTLFAAIDAYLSGLPDTGRALRLLLLDDAFAKVDAPTIGEFMGLLVRLDIDFAMTGHSLWGAYPQVPALDCYEVRRVEGSAAVTIHVHWDGHTRHLRAAR